MAAAAVAIGAVIVVLIAPLEPAIRATLWSAVLLTSFIGWGSLANLWLMRGAPENWADWGLRSAWGMALFILTGGCLCLLHLAIRPVLIAQVGLGVAALPAVGALRWRGALSLTSVRRRATVAIGRAGVVALIAGIYALTALTFFAYLGNHSFQPSDDPPLYFMMAEKLLQTSSLFEPFAGRRVSLFGANVYLHASFLSGASIYYLHVVDAGIAFTMAVGLLLGHVRQSSVKPWHAVPLALSMALLFTLLEVRVNTNSEVSGLVMALALYRTVRCPLGGGPERPLWPIEPRRLAALAALALVATLLRTSNAPAVLLFVAFILASDFLLGTRSPWSRQSLVSAARAAGVLSGTFLFGLLPWAILQKRTSGTFFYPFGHSNVTPGWTFLTTTSNWGQDGTELVMHLFHGRPVTLFPIFVLAGLVPLQGRAKNDLVAFSLAALLGLVVFSHKGVAFGAENTARYCFAFVAATALLTAASVGRVGTRAAVVAAALGLHLAANREDIRSMYDGYVKNAYAALHETAAEREPFDGPTADYRDVQSHVPVGATMATAVLEGFRFDFKRNTIFALDVLGGMGPKPGWPARQGPVALGNYLRANAVQYLVVVDFNAPGEYYNRAHWTSYLGATGSYLQGEAVLQLDAEDSIEKLTAMRHVVYKAHGMTVIDLGVAP